MKYNNLTTKREQLKNNMKNNVNWIICLVLLLFLCLYLHPEVKNVDFLSIDITIFSISVLLVTFIAPILSKVSNFYVSSKASIIMDEHNLDKKEYDLWDIKKENNGDITDREIQKLEEEIEAQKFRIEEEKYRVKEFEKLINYNIGENSKNDDNSSEKSTDPIEHFFREIHIKIRNCLIAITILILINYILFNSSVVNGFIYKTCSFITDYSALRLGISSFVGYASMVIQLLLLYRVSNVALNSVKNFTSFSD